LLVWRLGFALWAVTAAAACLAQAAPGGGQQPPAPASPEFVLRTETQLVLVPFHVVRQGKYVEGLQARDIRLLEDGVEQKVAVFEGPPSTRTSRSIPVEVILLLDVSLSVMNTNLLNGLALKEALLDGLGGNVGVSVYAFARRLKRFTFPTRDVAKLSAALASAYEFSHSGTRLYEAVIETCRDAARRGAATRLMVILSDSFSTSDTPPERAVAAARQFGVTLYPVVLGHERVVQQALRAEGRAGGRGPMDVPDRARGNRRRGDSAGRRRDLPGRPDRQVQARDREARMLEFAGMGEATGGRSFDPRSVNSAVMRAILQSIVAQVQAEYVVGYYPAVSEKPPAPRQVQVMLLDNKTGKLYGGRRLVVR